jgi:hypothetical protein
MGGMITEWMAGARMDHRRALNPPAPHPGGIPASLWHASKLSGKQKFYILWNMKAISLNVSESSYRKFQEIAERQGLPVSELIRRAMDEYLDRQYRARVSVLDLPAFKSGGILKKWKGADLYEDMTGR